MSRLNYVFLGLMLIIFAGCNTANKENTAQPPKEEQAAQQTSPASTPEAAAPQQSAAAPVTREPATAVKETKVAKQPSAQKPVSAPKTSAAPIQPDVQPAVQPSAIAPASMGQAAEPAAPAPPEPKFATIRSGSSIHVRLETPLDSGVNKTADTFRAMVDQDVLVDGKVIAPRGTIVEGKLTNVERSGRVEGRAAISMQLTKLLVENQSYPLQTDNLSFVAESTKKQDATKVGVGAGIGAVIGAIAGGGKGAAIGAAVGAGAGGATVVATRGKEVKLEAERKLSFALRSDVVVKLQ
jgi:hypothetical protein